MEIEIGEYIRCGTEGIRKVTEVIKSAIDFTVREIKDDKGLLIKREYIKKHSKNIIDLIEAGSYVNGHLVVEISKNAYNQKLVITEVDGKDGAIRHYYLEKSIKTIVTKEQFASIEYKVEEDK